MHVNTEERAIGLHGAYFQVSLTILSKYALTFLTAFLSISSILLLFIIFKSIVSIVYFLEIDQ